MPERESIVINTGPLIALIAAQGDLNLLHSLFRQAIVPFEVCREIEAGGEQGFGVREFHSTTFLSKRKKPVEIEPFLSNTLDRGEAAVIQSALNDGIRTVCIDEAVGRRIARLSGLAVTGSIGILIRAKKEGASFSMKCAIGQMREKGIWLSDRVIRVALEQTKE